MPPGNVITTTPVLPIVGDGPKSGTVVPEIVRPAPTTGGKMDPAVGQAGGSTAKALRRQLAEAKGRTRAEAPRPQPGKESAGQGSASGTPAASSDGKHPFLDLAGKGMEVVAKAEEVAIAAMKTQSDLWAMVTDSIGATAKRADKSAASWNGM